MSATAPPARKFAWRIEARYHGAIARLVFILVVAPLVALLAQELGYFAQMTGVADLFPQLQRIPVDPAFSAVTLVTALLGFIAVVSKKRAPQFALALCSAAILWLGFVYTRLRWYRFFDLGDKLAHYDAPTLKAWAIAFAILAAGAGLLLVDAHLVARNAYATKRVEPDEAAAAARALRRGALTAWLGGIAFALLFALAFTVLSGPLTRLPLPRINPVIGFGLIGLGLALAIAAVARATDVRGERPRLFQAKPRPSDAWAALPPPPTAPHAPLTPPPPDVGAPPNAADAWVRKEMEIRERERQRQP